MAERKEQEYEGRRQQIIDGALEVFAEKGYEKATNKDIAAAAGIASPGLIYHYFKDKADLFRQALQERAPTFMLLNHSEGYMVRPPREVLTRFASLFLETADHPAYRPAIKLMLGEAARRPQVAEMFNRIGPARGIAFLVQYLERQMAQGTLRKMDAGAAARAFLGPLVLYVLSRELFVQPDSETLTPETMVATSVDIFLRGMEVERSERADSD